MNDNPVICAVYVYPNLGGIYDDYAKRFVLSYTSNPTDISHTLCVVSNGEGPTGDMCDVFKDVPCQWRAHDNSGYDIGAFQAVAREMDVELMLFLGVSAYVRGKRWMERIVESFQKHGTALYGTMANTGCPPGNVWPHIRTTGFWLPASLMNQFPFTVKEREQRYAFEHGPECLTQWVLKQGHNAFLVDWQTEYEPKDWGKAPNTFHNGDQSGLIFGDKLSDPPFYG